MLKDSEYLLFIREIGRLINDFEKCKEPEVQQEILQDIKLLGYALQ
jgi:hypothetical protein